MRRQLAAVNTLDKTDGLDGLTSKQQLFVSLVFSGLNDTEAYRQAYDTAGMLEVSIRGKAHEVRHDPNVTAKLRELQDARDKQSTLAAALSRDWITNRIMQIADGPEKARDRLRALELLGKHVGIDLFRETTRVERIERTAEDIDKELETQLRSIATTLEGKATDITPRQAPAKRRRLKPSNT